MHEVKHPIWGSNLANQLSANDVYEGGARKMVKVRGLFGGEKMKQKWIDGFNRLATDDDSAKRYFRHRCGLLKIVMTPGRNGPTFVAFLDGHAPSNFDSHEIEFRFASEELADNEGKPVAEVWFSSTGKRWGPFSGYGTSRIVCTFANKEQTDQYLDVTNRRMPKSITHKGVTYGSTSSGQYQSSDGSILPYLLVMYFLLSSNEQQAFAAQNPEVQTMLPSDGEFGGAGASASFAAETPASEVAGQDDQMPASGAVYDDGGDNSGGTDSGGTDSGSSDSSGSSSDSGSSSSDSGSSSSSD